MACDFEPRSVLTQFLGGADGFTPLGKVLSALDAESIAKLVRSEIYVPLHNTSVTDAHIFLPPFSFGVLSQRAP